MHLKLLVTVAAISTLSACGGAVADDPAHIEVGIGSTSSALAGESGEAPQVAPENGARHLRLQVSEIRVHVAGGGEGRGRADGDDEGRGGWSTVFSGHRVVVLTANSPVQEILGSANARAGRITQIRLVLSSKPELVDGGTRTELECGSCEQSGLKIVPAGALALEPGGRHHVTIGFDVERSIVDEGGALRLKPVMRLDADR